jgi:catechol 2,3-dioxygenase-like lactoylglutathione lyase family enzyme
MNLGNFSISLAVADIAKSRAFYENLGFAPISGDQSQGWLILKGPTAVIGLFQGMFPTNILTFNPGWDSNARPLNDFTDIRMLQKSMKSTGLTLDIEADEATTGPASLTLTDPDGNVILVDQHR